MKGGPGRIFVFDDDGDDYEDMKTQRSWTWTDLCL